MSFQWIRRKHVKLLVLVLFLMFLVVNVNLYSTLYDYWRTKSAAVSLEGGGGKKELDLPDASLLASNLEGPVKPHTVTIVIDDLSPPTPQSLSTKSSGNDPKLSPILPSTPTSESPKISKAAPTPSAPTEAPVLVPPLQKIPPFVRPNTEWTWPTPSQAPTPTPTPQAPTPKPSHTPSPASNMPKPDNDANSTSPILSLDPSQCNYHGVPSVTPGVCACFVDYAGSACDRQTERPVFLHSEVLTKVDKNILPVGDTYLFGIPPVELGPDIAELFPLPKEQPIVYNSCALVANSEELLQVEWGAEIDSHDMVMRFNNAPLGKYERYVGNKTTYDFFNIYALNGARTGKAPWNSANRNATIIVHLRAPHWIAEYARFRRARPDIAVEILDSRLAKSMYDLWYAFVPDTKKFPTTGFFGILYSMRMCRHLHLYGFFKHTLQGVKYSKYNYHNNKGPDMWSHDQKVEREIITFIGSLHNSTYTDAGATPFIINESITYHNTDYQPKFIKLGQNKKTTTTAASKLKKKK